MISKSNRLLFSMQAGGLHLIASLFLAGCVAVLIYYFWYPFPYNEISGGNGLFWMLVSIDVICGPLLTFIFFNPEKSKAELAFDLSVVVIIQIVALVYGLVTLSQARPLAVVFEVDRYRVISYADVYEPEQSDLTAWVNVYSLNSPKFFGLKLSQSGSDLLQSIDMSLSGVEPSQRPSHWQAYLLSVPQIIEHAHPVSSLKAMHPHEKMEIERKIASSGLVEDKLLWLPFVSRHSADWIVFIDKKSAEPVLFMNLSGFAQ